jgi:hypothetical protein
MWYFEAGAVFYAPNFRSSLRPTDMDTPTFFDQIRALIARDEMDTALQQLRALLDNSPKLDEVLLQSARFQDIRKQIRLGLVSHAEANLTQNQIRAGLVDLLSEMEENIGRASNPSDVENTSLRAEVERAISIVHVNNEGATIKTQFNGGTFHNSTFE